MEPPMSSRPPQKKKDWKDMTAGERASSIVVLVVVGFIIMGIAIALSGNKSGAVHNDAAVQSSGSSGGFSSGDTQGVDSSTGSDTGSSTDGSDTGSATSTPSQSCYPLSNGGNCYEPGEYCRSADEGTSGVAGDGESIICEDNDGLRWEPN